jgi:hypothetical protein
MNTPARSTGKPFGTCAPSSGVEEHDYWLANPVEAIIFEPRCLADGLPRLADDLASTAGRYTEPPF